MNTTTILNATKWLTLTAALTSCGAASTKNEGEKAREIDSDLGGEWRDDCRPSDLLGLTHHKEFLKFSETGDYEREITSHSTSDCAAAELTFTVSGTLQALGDSPSVSNSKVINFSTTTATLKPESDSATKILLDSKYCGIQNWEKGKESDILNLDCLGVKHTKGEIVFDIYRASPDKKELRFGKETFWLDRSQASDRPTLSCPGSFDTLGLII